MHPSAEAVNWVTARNGGECRMRNPHPQNTKNKFQCASGLAFVEHADSGDRPSATSLRVPQLNRHYAAASTESWDRLRS